MSVGSLTVAGEGDDARERSRLRLHVAVGKTVLHALLQRAVHTADGQRLHEVALDVVVAVGIAQESHLQLGTEVVVERETGPVCQLISSGVEPYLAYELTLHAPCALGTGGAVARGSGYLVVHALGIEVVALLHHPVQYLVHGVEAGTQRESTRRTSLLRRAEAGVLDADVTELGEETVHEDVLSGEHQRREHRVVVIPAPSLAQQVGILHRTVGIYAATDGVHAHLLQTVGESRQVVGIEPRVHTADAVHVAREYSVLYRARVFQLGLELVGSAQLVEGGDGGEEFHRTGRAHQLAFTVAVDAGVCLQVPHHQSHLRGLEHLRLQEFADAHLYRLRPGQPECVGGEGVHNGRVLRLHIVLVLDHLLVARSLNNGGHILGMGGQHRHQCHRPSQDDIQYLSHHKLFLPLFYFFTFLPF